MKNLQKETKLQRWIARFAVLALIPLVLLAQQPPPSDQAPPPPPLPEQGPAAGTQPLLSAQQLDDLVAPVALYPDNLLSQILVASTYPLEVVEAQQWLQQNPNLQGQALMNAAKQQNWDPSIQALVMFPDVLMRLNSDIRWTTELGNAFLAQQPDVMAAVQRMRARAQANGKLMSNSQQNVTTQTQNGQTVIQIVPTNPDVIYVPAYNPYWVWGPPVYVYPPVWYPGIDVGFVFGPGIFIGGFFGGWGGWGWGGWGWGFNWFGGAVIVNNSFFHRFGFRDFHGGYEGTSVWAHNPEHRIGVPYPNREVANRYGGAAVRGPGAYRGGEGGNRGFAEPGNVGERGNRGGAEASREPTQRFGSPGFEQHDFGTGHSAFGGIHNGGSTRFESDHGFGSMSGSRGGGFGGGVRGGGGFRGGGGGRR